MALDPSTEPMRRATHAARAASPDSWVDLSASIMSEVRSVVTPAEPVVTWTPDGSCARDDQGSRDFVSTRVLTASIRRLLQRPTHAPVSIELAVESERLVGVHVALACSYGEDLHALGASVHEEVLSEIRGIVGPDPAFGRDRISVAVVDVVEGDPTRV